MPNPDQQERSCDKCGEPIDYGYLCERCTQPRRVPDPDQRERLQACREQLAHQLERADTAEQEAKRLREIANEAFGILNARTDLSDSQARHKAKRKLRAALEDKPFGSGLRPYTENLKKLGSEDK